MSYQTIALNSDLARDNEDELKRYEEELKATLVKPGQKPKTIEDELLDYQKQLSVRFPLASQTLQQPKPSELNQRPMPLSDQARAAATMTEPQYPGQLEQPLEAAPIPVSPRPADRGLVSSINAGFGDMTRSVGGALDYTGRALGVQGVRDTGKSMKATGDQWVEESGATPYNFEGKNVVDMAFDPQFWEKVVARGFPNNALLSTVSGLVSMGAGTIAQKLPAGKAVAEGLGKILPSKYKGLAKIAPKIAGFIAGSVMARPIESAMEAGQVAEEAIKRGKTEEEAYKAADSVFMENMALAAPDALQNYLMFAGVPGKIVGDIARRSTQDVATQSAIRLLTSGTSKKVAKIAATGVTEGMEEGVQEVSQRKALGDEINLDSEMQMSILAGGLTGGVTAGAVGLVPSSDPNLYAVDPSMRPKKKPTPQIPAPWSRHGANLAKGVPDAVVSNPDFQEGISSLGVKATAQVDESGDTIVITPESRNPDDVAAVAAATTPTRGSGMDAGTIIVTPKILKPDDEVRFLVFEGSTSNPVRAANNLRQLISSFGSLDPMVSHDRKAGKVTIDIANPNDDEAMTKLRDTINANLESLNLIGGFREYTAEVTSHEAEGLAETLKGEGNLNINAIGRDVTSATEGVDEAIRLARATADDIPKRAHTRSGQGDRNYYTYDIVDLKDLVPSNVVTGNTFDNWVPTPGFADSGINQDRDRGQATGKEQVRKISEALEPHLLIDLRPVTDSVHGSPVIGEFDNLVESGNGRTMALMHRAMADESNGDQPLSNYRSILISALTDASTQTSDKAIASAAKTLLSTKITDPNIAIPILVRRRIDKQNRGTFSSGANVEEILGMNSSELSSRDFNMYVKPYESLLHTIVVPNNSMTLTEILASRANTREGSVINRII